MYLNIVHFAQCSYSHIILYESVCINKFETLTHTFIQRIIIIMSFPFAFADQKIIVIFDVIAVYIIIILAIYVRMYKNMNIGLELRYARLTLTIPILRLWQQKIKYDKLYVTNWTWMNWTWSGIRCNSCNVFLIMHWNIICFLVDGIIMGISKRWIKRKKTSGFYALIYK